MTIANLKLPWDSSTVLPAREPDASILEGLGALAYADADVAARAESLFMFIRKNGLQAIVKEYLIGIQYLAIQGDPAGARLLAAFVDVSTPGDRLMPRVARFSSSRRLNFRILSDSEDPGNIHQDWLLRLDEMTNRCLALDRESGLGSDSTSVCPGREPPWPSLRDNLQLLFARLSLGDDFEAEDRKLLVELLRLEVDAWQERISHLAGSIDPFRVAAISRILPILGVADAEIRDLRQMISWIEEGCRGTDFNKPQSRSLDVLEDNDRTALRAALSGDPELASLADLFEGLADHPVRVPVMAHCMKQLQDLAERLALLGVPGVELDLVTAALLIQTHFPTDGNETEYHLPLPPGFPEACGHILEIADSGMGKEAAHLSGMRIQGESLVIAIPEGGAYLEHDFPTVASDPATNEQADEIQVWADDLLAEPGAEIDEDGEIDLNEATSAELKHLVMTNIQSTSVLLGFLRNPKIVAIPGLVEEVVNRTRNPVVIETICKARILHTGFANRGVPLACLRSPVNISLSTLRKFMHVKFVSKVDLKRMALDKSGIRKEVGREVKKYLESLT
ncbi:MAG: hypothetical protein KAH56_08110 [Candidatus Krumholzibacteria bacterium]|nr:hypothetical protein [Candidatus Krumholzibacteria bacterium]